jgi:hypothetical protein
MLCGNRSFSGFLSGLTTFHAIVAFVFTDVIALVKGYQHMAAPMHAIFYFCFVISAIDAMDRYSGRFVLILIA